MSDEYPVPPGEPRLQARPLPHRPEAHQLAPLTIDEALASVTAPILDISDLEDEVEDELDFLSDMRSRARSAIPEEPARS